MQELHNSSLSLISWARSQVAHLQEQLSNETELKLERKLRNEEPGIRGLAIEALARKNTPKAIELIISSLGDEDYSVRLTSIFEVVKLKIKEAIPSLIEIINNDENNEVVAVATDVLGDLGAEEAIPSLIEKLTDDNETVREAAADSLGKLGAKEAVEPLRMLLNDDEEFVRETAKRAIEKIERKKET